MLKSDLPNSQAISPSKFDDKFKLEDKVRDLTSKVKKEYKTQNNLLIHQPETTLEIEIIEDFPTDLAQISEEILKVEQNFNLATSEIQKLIREKLILEKKHDLSEQQSSDIRILGFTHTNLGSINEDNEKERFQISEKIYEKEAKIFEQEAIVKTLHKQILDLKQRLMILGGIREDEHYDEEMLRLREILDILNRRIEDLKVITSREDEQSHVCSKILLDKDKLI
mmetsp:Transcript_22038/g.19599  ORF Transcript_22038/g.19599 Transcript_22038/m.19599 type:complete len:225 (+) Transcript_22038:238-912(+)